MSYSSKQPRLIFDIETQANPENLALMPEPIVTAPANYKDPVKIEEYIKIETEKKKAELIEKAALDPDYGRVLSIGYATSCEGPITVHAVGEVYFAEQTIDAETCEPVIVEYVYTEKDLIRGFWDVFARCCGACIGFNILGFDLPYLMARSMYLGVRVPYQPALAKFRCEPVTDLYAIRYNWGPGKGLKVVCKLLGIENDCPDIDGSKVKDLTPEQLREYQASDVKLTIALFQKMNGVYFNL
jgi:DNA polymerase elongation subunit (family B)